MPTQMKPPMSIRRTSCWLLGVAPRLLILDSVASGLMSKVNIMFKHESTQCLNKVPSRHRQTNGDMPRTTFLTPEPSPGSEKRDHGKLRAEAIQRYVLHLW